MDIDIIRKMYEKILTPDDMYAFTKEHAMAGISLDDESEELRAICIDFIDQLSEITSYPPCERDKYFTISIRIWLTAVINHIAIMCRGLSESEKVDMVKSFRTLLMTS